MSIVQVAMPILMLERKRGGASCTPNLIAIGARPQSKTKRQKAMEVMILELMEKIVRIFLVFVLMLFTFFRVVISLSLFSKSKYKFKAPHIWGD